MKKNRETSANREQFLFQLDRFSVSSVKLGLEAHKHA